jgi:hypothetical protein
MQHTQERWKMHTTFLLQSLKVRDLLVDLDREGMIMFSLILKTWEGVNWIYVLQGTGQWPVLVNTVVNVSVPGKVGNLLTGLGTVSFSRKTWIHVVSYSLFRLQWQNSNNYLKKSTLFCYVMPCGSERCLWTTQEAILFTITIMWILNPTFYLNVFDHIQFTTPHFCCSFWWILQSFLYT